MNDLELRLKLVDSGLFSKFEETKLAVNLLLGKYSANFPTYTDHSAAHTLEVFEIASDLLTKSEIENLNADEIYILSMACLLHDIGMCIPVEKIKEISNSDDFIEYKKAHPDISTEEYIRDIHHLLSEQFILTEWEELKIPSEKYALGIGRVAAGHRKVDIGDFDIYEPRFFAKGGKSFTCLPYLSAILRIADELDVTNSRTPRLLTKYYMPNNEISIREWEKHMATSQRNYLDGTVVFEVVCSDQNIYAALQEQFEKIQNVINLCQKVIRSVPNIRTPNYSLDLGKVIPKYTFKGFDPKGIKFSFDVQNVVTAFIGEDLYKDRFTALREAIQNSIDSCRYKLKVLKENFTPIIKITVTNESLIIQDNGAGMDEFVIENFFGKLASSFYEQEKVKDHFEAIGQFGVGVFSYFLLAEYIDIETKTETSCSLKFRFDKDPQSYFHFFDKTERVISGTTLTIVLKEEVKDEISFETVQNYITTIFKHIEIPILINHNHTNREVNFQPFLINSEKEINEKLKLQFRKKSADITTFNVSLDTADFEGVYAILVGSNYLDTFNLCEYFDYDNFNGIDGNRDYSQVSLSQKGVFVNNYSSELIGCTIGTINLKKKIKINIDRNKFSNSKDIRQIHNEFEFAIVKKVFSYLNTQFKSDDEKLKITNDFLNNYLRYVPSKKILTTDFYEFLLEIIYVKLYFDSKTQIVNLKFIQEINDDIAITDSENEIKELLDIGYSYVIEDADKYDGRVSVVNSLFHNLLGYSCFIRCIDHKGFYIFKKSEEDLEFSKFLENLYGVIGYFYLRILPSNSDKLILATGSKFLEEDSGYYFENRAFNYNHRLIKFFRNHFSEIKENSVNIKTVKSIVDYVFRLTHSPDKITEASLIPLNEMLEHLSKLGKIDAFSLRDFHDFDVKELF